MQTWIPRLLAMVLCTAALPAAEVLDSPENLVKLLNGDFWKEAGMLGVGFVGRSIWGGVVWFVIGLLAGLVLYGIFRATGLIKLEYSWYRYIRWIWAPLCMLSLAIGLGYGGLWMGAAKSVDKAIVEKGVIKRMVANVYCAVALDKSDYEVQGNETAEEMIKLFDDAPELMSQAQSNLSHKVDAIYQNKATDPEVGKVQRWLFKILANTKVEETLMGKLGETVGEKTGVGEYMNEAKYVFTLVYLYTSDRAMYDSYVKDRPELSTASVAIGQGISHVEKESTKWVHTAAKANLWGGGITGIAIPLGAGIVFRLCVWLIEWTRSKVPGLKEEDEGIQADEAPPPGSGNEGVDLAVGPGTEVDPDA